MIKNLKHILIRGTAFLMIGILGLLIANKAFYLHTHKLDDGKLIVHAHPYHKSNESEPFKMHHHTSVLSSLIANLEILFVFALFFGLLFLSAKSIIRKACYDNRFSIHLLPDQGRAPPCL